MPDKSWVGSLRRSAMNAGMPSEAVLLIVDAAHQQVISLDSADVVTAVFPVSTSRYGLGEKHNSGMTPRGFHRVFARFGDGATPGTLFRSRKATGVIVPRDAWSQSGDDLVLTRIFRLRGMEPGINQGKGVDSLERLIYIHGTNQEQHVGVRPSSQGCIRMRNDDIVALADSLSDCEVWCWIGDPPFSPQT